MAEDARANGKSGDSGGKPQKKISIFLRTFGCQMNLRDSEVVSGLLTQAGFEIVDDELTADIVIFNTCSVRQHAEDRVWSQIGRIAKLWKKKKLKLQDAGINVADRPLFGIIGCMAKNYQQSIFDQSKDVDFVVGPADISKIPEIIKKLTVNLQSTTQGKKSNLYDVKIWETDGDLRPEEIYHTGFYDKKDHAFVVISEGCSNFCSYCVVPYTRGALRHRKIKDILDEIKQASDKGINKITLLGQNVNAYISPDSTTKSLQFVDLLKAVNKLDQIKEFTFITSHPKDTNADFFKVISECEKLKKYLHLPFQSGSDKILKLMNRGYTRKNYLDLVDNYRRIVVGGMLSTDIILGFPSETEEDFQDTYSLVKDVGFDSAFIFKYSPRPHTAALSYPDDVSKEEKERRHALILELQREISSRKKKHD